MNPISINFTNEQLQKIKRVADINGLDINEYLKQIVKNNIDTTIYLNNKYTYDLKNKILLNPNQIPIHLTKAESIILDYLIQNINSYVTIDELSELFANHKTMSVFTLRNKINYIRNKTCNEFIQSEKMLGYKICNC